MPGNPAVCDACDQIDLVFSDVRMPGEMDGFGLALWIQENHKTLPVILTSGDIGPANIARKVYSGEMFLPKPYELHAVAEQITKLVGSIAA